MEAEPRRAVIFGLTMAHANHRLTAVPAVQLPWRMLHCSDFQGRYRPRAFQWELYRQTVVGGWRGVRHDSCQLGIIHQHRCSPNDAWG